MRLKYERVKTEIRRDEGVKVLQFQAVCHSSGKFRTDFHVMFKRQEKGEALIQNNPL